MKKSLISVLGMAVLLVGCASEGNVTKNTINQEEVMAKMSLEDKAHFVIGTGMEGFSGDEAVIGATKNLVPGAASYWLTVLQDFVSILHARETLQPIIAHTSQ